jgi:hypothetical protein
MRVGAVRGTIRGYLHIYDGFDQLLASLEALKHLESDRFGLLGGTEGKEVCHIAIETFVVGLRADKDIFPEAGLLC